jgi:hypothetical protein
VEWILRKLCGSGRFKPLHLALWSFDHLMRVFGAIVLSEAPMMRTGEARVPESRAAGTQLVGDQQQLAH